jgi:hypothetical protein
MYIFQKKKNGEVLEIHGPNVPLDRIYGRLVDGLGIGSGCNLFNVLMKIANFEENLHVAWVESIEPGHIFFRKKTKDINVPGRFVTAIDGDLAKSEEILEFMRIWTL